jgi:HEAT repeat protein
MLAQQLDLFSADTTTAERLLARNTDPPLVAPELDDDALIAAISESSLAHSHELAAEAGRRRLAAAVPALAALCRRFAGFGARHTVPEQAAAIESLVSIGSREAALAISAMIEQAVVQGPGLSKALSAAGRLGSPLSISALRDLLQHADPSIRAAACRCARSAPEIIRLLIDLLDDLDEAVATSAASALGRMGRIEARPKLKSLLRHAPSEEAMDAISLVADEECVVLLGRVARSMPILADAALASLEDIELARAATVAAGVRRLQLSG